MRVTLQNPRLDVINRNDDSGLFWRVAPVLRPAGGSGWPERPGSAGSDPTQPPGTPGQKMRWTESTRRPRNKATNTRLHHRKTPQCWRPNTP